MYNSCLEYAEHIAKEVQYLYDHPITDEEDETSPDIYTYCNDCLDIEFTLDCHKVLIGVLLYVTLGGPNCWIDTRHNRVCCEWGMDKASVPLSSDICDTITDYFADCMDFIR